LSRYNLTPSHEQSVSPIPSGALATVFADFGARCHSPALCGHLLLNISSPAELVDLCNCWIAALVDHGACQRRATAFVAREEACVRESLVTAAADPCCRADTLGASNEEAA